MHPEALAWLRWMVHRRRPRGLVVEIGSRLVCGTIRPCFSSNLEYVGVDILPGPMVDVVADGAEIGFGRLADVVACCEVLEHAHWPMKLVHNLFRLCRPGGLLLITAATEPRQPHSGRTSAPQPEPGEWYANVRPDFLANWLSSYHPTQMGMEVYRDRGDVYAWAQNS